MDRLKLQSLIIQTVRVYSTNYKELSTIISVTSQEVTWQQIQNKVVKVKLLVVMSSTKLDLDGALCLHKINYSFAVAILSKPNFSALWRMDTHLPYFVLTRPDQTRQYFILNEIFS
ncbi:hypothetical protein PHYBLDRAFT_70619 [Phycomyces blakesleeanus NRRL 1555(-)]|uniref:Uncharacterized protein n=1 Tax=Phycomyces blakesleeanus (strain ATCC 8743b / DSM 1359 / FGSC 10004 / NBRC 33097 / NRRL 1555) TaxID=763407 RepID=A0A163A1M5_PHYB8|nr:hypothetical protein PHYBLDRAFT_70619 [Phycomyces blakesleeanus NRRL 1555(-)]OAD70461.1 hypothetical protein PHYBLDRAFT_70619 [Phycomyces blakesleeanus NRRL 1555(-)]|eukprot:XP_018288501.1 hypothetical protein PHYBLDRAFT_70619 [Phycomyces blakesleeanus NRRL 1555(-)]